MIRNMRSPQNINICCGSAQPVPLILDGHLLDFGEKGLEPDPGYAIALPSNLKAMISLAKRLSEGIPFLRVDFYNINGAIYFGELTFYPASGMGRWTPDEADIKIGGYLQI